MKSGSKYTMEALQSDQKKDRVEGEPVDGKGDVTIIDGKNGEAKDSMEEEEHDEECGCGKFRPSCLQRFNTPKFLLAAMCWFALFQGFVVNGINNVNTTSLERRYQLPSSEVGWISSGYDVSAAIFVLPFSFMGLRANKPRWLFFSAVIMSVGSFVYLLPKMTSGAYHSGEASETCKLPSNGTETCEKSSLSNYLYVFIAGQALHGVGGTILYTIGSTFLDDSIDPTSSPLYIGIFYAAAGLGPALGYLVGGQFLNYYVDFDTASPSFETTDPRWVGAWWIGLIVSCVCLAVAALLILPYPSSLPGVKKMRQKQKSQSCQSKGTDKVDREDFGSSIKDFPVACKVLLTNPTFMFITLGACTEGMVGSAFATYLPKFVQNQFLQTAGMSAMLAGVMAVPGVAGGQLFGGIFANKMKLQVKGMLKFSTVTIAISLVGCSVIWLSCDQANLAGVITSYPNTTGTSDLGAACNSQCGCDTASYDPVCADDIQYFSPCHAGCSGNFSSGFHTCQCVASGPVATINDTVTVGPCTTQCSMMYVFIPLFFLTVFCMFASAPCILSVTLRCVPDSQRVFAIGLQWVFVRCLGTIPGPVIAGAIIDSACVVWQETCGERGSCWVYSSSQLSLNLFILAVGFKVFTVLFFVLAYKLYKPAPTADGTPVRMSELPTPDSGGITT